MGDRTGHGLRHDVNCSILFTELDVLERPAAAKGLGFDAIELWWPFPQAVPPDHEVERLISAVEDAGVTLVALNFFAGDMPGGERGVLSLPARTSEFRDNVDVVVAIGERLGTRCFNALYGNRLVGLAPAEQDETALANLAMAADAVARIDGTVLLEPVSGVASYPLLAADQVLAVVDRVRDASGVQNLGLLADLYHLAVNGDDVDRVIEEHAADVRHVQIADAPGRHEPGSGTLALGQQLAALEAAGYSGWVGLEYTPSGASADSFEWLAHDRRGVSH